VIDGNAYDPQIAIDGSGNATAVWHRHDGSYYFIQASTKLFGDGKSWSPPEDLSLIDGNALYPQIAVDGSGNAMTVWCRNDVIQSSSNTIVSVPTVTSVSPNFGPISGGNTVIITGTNFRDVTAVTFGETSALSFTPVSETSLMAVAPAGFFGTMEHVTVTASSKTSAQTASDQYTYEIQPPLPSQKFVGKIHPRTHKYRYSLHTRWKLSPSPNVVRYEIYTPGHHCIASIDATLAPKKNINFFAHFLKTRDITDRFLHETHKKYKIRAVDVYGQKSHFTHVEAKK
jgi:hypothetical protein